MVKALVHDPILLAGQSEKAGKADVFHAYDLLDTLMAHKEGCAGMAANMIGIRKRIIVFVTENGSYMMMLNPVILQKQKPYDTEESCLSLLGGPRKCTRYEQIRVQYQSVDMQTHVQDFSGWTAQIIQHEIDHCNGVLI